MQCYFSSDQMINFAVAQRGYFGSEYVRSFFNMTSKLTSVDDVALDMSGAKEWKGISVLQKVKILKYCEYMKYGFSNIGNEYLLLITKILLK